MRGKRYPLSLRPTCSGKKRNKKMSESTVISDVRQAKQWLDKACSNMQELGERLAAIELAFVARTGEFASVPRGRSEAVRKSVQSAADEPGRALLDEVRPSRRP